MGGLEMKAGLLGSGLFILLPVLVLFSPLASRGVSGGQIWFYSNTQCVASCLALQGNGATFDSNPQPSTRQNVVRIAAYLIHWVIVPLILIIMFLYALRLPYQSSNEADQAGADEAAADQSRDGTMKKAGTAGIFSGLILFIVFTLTLDAKIFEVSFSIPAYDFSFSSVIWLVVGAGAGFFVMCATNRWGQDATPVAFLVMILTAATLTVTYSYFLYFGARSTIVYLALGGMFGALIRVMVNPKKAEH